MTRKHFLINAIGFDAPERIGIPIEEHKHQKGSGGASGLRSERGSGGVL